MVQAADLGAEQAHLNHFSLDALHLDPIANGVAVLQQHHQPSRKIPQQSLEHKRQRSQQGTTGQQQRHRGGTNARDIQQHPEQHHPDPDHVDQPMRCAQQTAIALLTPGLKPLGNVHIRRPLAEQKGAQAAQQERRQGHRQKLDHSKRWLQHQLNPQGNLTGDRHHHHTEHQHQQVEHQQQHADAQGLFGVQPGFAPAIRTPLGPQLTMQA